MRSDVFCVPKQLDASNSSAIIMDINNIESKRLVLPPRIAAIVEDAQNHPEKGHVLSRINAHGQRLRDKKARDEDATNKKPQRTNGEPGDNGMSNDNESTSWHKAINWVKSNGGYIHPQLSYNESERQVYLNHNNNPSSSITTTIDSGTTLLRIPDICLPSLHSVESDEEFGKSLFGVVHALEGSLYHDAQDVVLALYLAQQQQQQQKSFYEPYLRTLPINTTNKLSNCSDESPENNELLPRQWDTNTLKRRLDGSSLYSRIVDERNGILAEYGVVKTAWEQQQQLLLQQKQQQQQKEDDKDNESNKTNTTSQSTFPTCDQYDQMMSQVTSRGFDGLGYDGVDVMIPLLDLLNHSRGRGQSNDDDDVDVANVRYERYCEEEGQKDDDAKEEGGDDDDDEPAPKRVKKGVDNYTKNNNGTKNISNSRGGVRVTAGQAIASKRTKLQMTYGAKSNSTLLGRYGFCIADNVEPDGEYFDYL